MSPGCLSLLTMRELMEDMKEDPKSLTQPSRVGWDYTFDTQDIESTEYMNESKFMIDPTVSQIEIFFDASIGDAISDFANETFPGLIEEVGARYVEISVWEPGEYPSGTPFSLKEQLKTTNLQRPISMKIHLPSRMENGF